VLVLSFSFWSFIYCFNNNSINMCRSFYYYYSINKTYLCHFCFLSFLIYHPIVSKRKDVQLWFSMKSCSNNRVAMCFIERDCSEKGIPTLMVNYTMVWFKEMVILIENQYSSRELYLAREGIPNFEARLDHTFIWRNDVLHRKTIFKPSS
jgi:hypothetical protein